MRNLSQKITRSTSLTALTFVLIGLSVIVVAQLARYYIASSSDIFQDGTWYATYHPFRVVHLEVNYLDHGYLRRGLVGTILHLCGVEDVQFLGWLVSLFSILAFLGILGYVTATLPPERRTALYLVLAIAVLGPAGIPQFIVTAGHIDHVLLPLLAAAALAGIKGRLVLSLGLFLVMYQVHELTIIAFTPLLLACNILGSRTRSDLPLGVVSIPVCWRAILAFGIASCLLLGLTLTHGDSLLAAASFAETGDTRALYGEMVWGGDSPIHAVAWQGIPSAVLLGYYACLILFCIAYWKNMPAPLFWIPLAAASCLLLNLVGVDAGRWAAIATWTVMVAVLVTEMAGRSVPLRLPVPGLAIVFGLLLALPIGPAGSTVPFTFTLKLLGIPVP